MSFYDQFLTGGIITTPIPCPSCGTHIRVGMAQMRLADLTMFSALGCPRPGCRIFTTVCREALQDLLAIGGEEALDAHLRGEVAKAHAAWIERRLADGAHPLDLLAEQAP